MNELTTVIVPCYNEVKYIEKVIKNILNNSLKNKEIIIVDDFSTDGTKEILKSKIEPLVDKVIYHEKIWVRGLVLKAQ